MALQDLLNLSSTKDKKKIGLSQERVEAIIPIARQYIAFWREYPDIFVDFLVRGTRTEVREGEFKFYFYQRVFLRAAMRHQYLYAVFPRASIGANKFSLIAENFGQTSLIVGTLNSYINMNKRIQSKYKRRSIYEKNAYYTQKTNSNTKPISQFDKDNNLIATYPSAREAGRQLNLDSSRKCCKKLKTVGGYIFKYA